jgi:hypothetical protein
MRIAYLFAILLLADVSMSADAPITVYISSHGIEVDGVAYRSPVEAMKALKKLNPKAVHFVPIQGVPYEAVYVALEAFQKSGIQAQTGFVGSEKR